jgi:hypothetical protein
MEAADVVHTSCFVVPLQHVLARERVCGGQVSFDA